MSSRLSWPILADLGQARDAHNGSKMAEFSAKLGPRWPKMGLVWPSSGREGSYLGYFRGSWGRSLQKWPKCKNEHHYGVLATFSGLGGSCWKPWGLSWKVLARSWGVLGELGIHKTPFWQHVETKMAKMSQDRRTWKKNVWL